MCAPTTAAVMLGTGALMSGISAMQNQSAANQAADFNARMAEESADAAEVAALETTQKGQRDKTNLRKQIARHKGSQRASYGASGVLVDSGSAADIVGDTQMLGDIDAYVMEMNTQRETRNYLQKAMSDRRQADFLRLQKRDPWEAGLTSLIGSGASAGATYAMYSSPRGGAKT